MGHCFFDEGGVRVEDKSDEQMLEIARAELEATVARVGNDLLHQDVLIASQRLDVLVVKGQKEKQTKTKCTKNEGE